jgi:hypothetical protein
LPLGLSQKLVSSPYNPFQAYRKVEKQAFQTIKEATPCLIALPEIPKPVIAI